MQRDYDVIIVGGGPAGLSAAIYALRAGLRAALLERQFIGGQAAITNEIENYPGFRSIGGQELTELMFTQAKAYGLVSVSQEVKSIEKRGDDFFIKTAKQEYACGALIYAAGATPKKLGIEQGFEGAGVSYCATCDGNFYRGRDVAVIGGGDTALKDAVYLAKLARKVYIVHRRDEFRGGKMLAQRLDMLSNVEKVLSFVPVEIRGTPGENLEGLLVKSVKTGEDRVLPVDGIFMAVGQTPSSGLVKDLVELDGNGYIKSDALMKTSLPGLFAAGDVRDTVLRQVVTACADGAVAAEQAALYLDEK